MTDRSALVFTRDGAQLFEGALRSSVEALKAAVVCLPHDEAGVRIHGLDALKPLLAADGAVGSVAASILGPEAKPVRALFFNKSMRKNWSLQWHQDRTICVKQKEQVPGFGPWTIKSGMHHVAPPFELLARMVTIRAHIDDVPETNAPLLIAPGSHAFGRVAVGDVDQVVRRCGIVTCLAEAGDLWLYSTPILHASEAASAPGSRRVLQVDFACESLPHGLEWLGI